MIFNFLLYTGVYSAIYLVFYLVVKITLKYEFAKDKKRREHWSLRYLVSCNDLEMKNLRLQAEVDEYRFQIGMYREKLGLPPQQILPLMDLETYNEIFGAYLESREVVVEPV